MKRYINIGWFLVLIYGVSTLSGSFKAKLSHFGRIFKQFSLVGVKVFVYPLLNVKTDLFQTIQFSISTHLNTQLNLKTFNFGKFSLA